MRFVLNFSMNAIRNEMGMILEATAHRQWVDAGLCSVVCSLFTALHGLLVIFAFHGSPSPLPAQWHATGF